MVTINRKLNLVIPIVRGDDTTLYIHSSPISSEVYETYYRVLSKTWASIVEDGVLRSAGPSVSYFKLKDVAENTMRAPGLNWWDGPDGVNGEKGLINAMLQRSNALVMHAEKGWGTLPLSLALQQGLIDDDEKREVLALIVFFTVLSHVPPRLDRKDMIEGMARNFNYQATFSNATEYAISLKTSTIEENTGEKNQA